MHDCDRHPDWNPYPDRLSGLGVRKVAEAACLEPPTTWHEDKKPLWGPIKIDDLAVFDESFE